jgi:hypothetical protein
LLLLLALLACGTAPPAAHDGAHDGAPHAHDQAPGHAESASPLALTLDGDARWQMDTHTREVVARTRASLASADVHDAASAAALGDTLQEQLDQLITGCTMTGASHDQLHVFLTAWMPEVAALRKTTELEEGKARIGRLEAMLEQYGRHFE